MAISSPPTCLIRRAKTPLRFCRFSQLRETTFDVERRPSRTGFSDPSDPLVVEERKRSSLPHGNATCSLNSAELVSPCDWTSISHVGPERTKGFHQFSKHRSLAISVMNDCETSPEGFPALTCRSEVPARHPQSLDWLQWILWAALVRRRSECPQG